MLLDCLANPIEENWDRLYTAGESFPELQELDVSLRTVAERPPPADPCIVLVESFASVRHAVPDEIVVYVVRSVDEGELGIRDLYFSRLPEV
jgi:hypothetical protein